MDTLEIECCIRGYHVYQDIWEAAIDEELVCRPERSNGHDRYAVAVMKNDLVVGHLPSNFSRLYTLSIRRGGVILIFYATWQAEDATPMIYHKEDWRYHVCYF